MGQGEYLLKTSLPGFYSDQGQEHRAGAAAPRDSGQVRVLLGNLVSLSVNEAPRFLCLHCGKADAAVGEPFPP